jgi:hypothetical protein
LKTLRELVKFEGYTLSLGGLTSLTPQLAKEFIRAERHYEL